MSTRWIWVGRDNWNVSARIRITGWDGMIGA
jgi:hypothetical protein